MINVALAYAVSLPSDGKRVTEAAMKRALLKHLGLPTFGEITPDAGQAGRAGQRVVLDFGYTTRGHLVRRAEHRRAGTRCANYVRSDGVIELIRRMRKFGEFGRPACACANEYDIDFIAPGLAFGRQRERVEGAAQGFFAILRIRRDDDCEFHFYSVLCAAELCRFANERRPQLELFYNSAKAGTIEWDTHKSV
jgi:hypothetical protein